MQNDKTMEWLMSLSLPQLERLEQVVLEKAAQKAEQARKLMASPLRSSSDLEALASLQGLDITGLMREIGKR